MKESRIILHADMDAFYAAIEQRDHPEYRQEPVIVGGLGRRGVVSAASYEARKWGIHSAQPMAEARALCPQGIFLRTRMKVYAEVSRTIRAIFEGFTPLVEPLSLDEAFLDVTGSRLLFGSGEEIARKLRERVLEATGLRVSVGVATSKYVAKVASDLEKPDGLVVVPPGGEKDFLAGLPVDRLWGAGRATQARFAELDIHRIGDVQKLSERELVAIFGKLGGEHFHALCRGIDDRPVVPDREPKSISHEVTFEKDLRERDECHLVLLELSEEVGRRLRKEGFLGGTVKLKIRFPPFETRTRQAKLEKPSFDDLEIYRRVRELFEGVRKGDRPVRLLGVGVADLLRPGEGGQADLFVERDEGKKRLLQAMDEIRDRFGSDAIRHGGA